MNNLLNKGAILLISGPSGCGKSSLLNKLYNEIDNYYFSISTTTRAPRLGETDGVEYFFTTKEQFEEDIQKDNFLEWAEVHGNYYGTSLIPIKQALKENKLVIFDIDVQGFEQVIQKFKDITTTVFITTPSLKELKLRLYNRATDNEKIIQHRLENARKEIEYIDKYDYLLINNHLETAAKQLIAIAKVAKIKSSLFNKQNIIKQWLT